VVLTIATFLIAPPDSAPRNDGSSYAAHAEGSKAAYLLLRELGYDVRRSHEPLTAIVEEPAGVTLVLANPSEKPSQLDVRALRTFVENGGVVLATGSAGAAFLPDLAGPGDRPRSSESRPTPHTASLPSPLSAGISRIDMPTGQQPLPPASPYLAVFGNQKAPAVAAARLGEGESIWWAGSGPLTNAGIGNPGHAELLINAVGVPGVRSVLWDEFYHGHTRSFWSYLADTPLPFAVAQLGFIIAAGLFAYSRRRRPIRARVTEPRTSPLEFIDTMGGLYERARAASAAVETVRSRVRHRVLTNLGLPPASGDDQLVRVAAERLALDGPALSALLARSRTAAADPRLTAGQALPIVAGLQKIATLMDSRARGQRDKERGREAR
jgi:hypothetical protein